MMKLQSHRVAILVAALASGVLTANLGAWQLRRASSKIAMQDTLATRAQLPALTAADLNFAPAEAAAQHHRTAQLQGRWRPEHTVFLENRQMQGRVGFYVVTPLQLEGPPQAVLVQRGWVPRDLRDRTLVPSVPTAPGVITLQGRVAPPPGRLYEFSAAASGVIRQNLELGGFATETGLNLAPFSILQTDAAAANASDGLLRAWPQPAVDVQKHYGYAFQWFALCALIAGLYVWFQLLRPRFKR
jgi:surfeit locus 1 family protein